MPSGYRRAGRATLSVRLRPHATRGPANTARLTSDALCCGKTEGC